MSARVDKDLSDPAPRNGIWIPQQQKHVAGAMTVYVIAKGTMDRWIPQQQQKHVAGAITIYVIA